MILRRKACLYDYYLRVGLSDSRSEPDNGSIIVFVAKFSHYALKGVFA